MPGTGLERYLGGNRRFLEGTFTATGTATALSATSVPCIELMIQCHPDATGRILVGNNTGQHWVITAGNNVVILVDDLTNVYVKSSTGSVIGNYLARG